MPPLPWKTFTEIDPGREYLVMGSRLPLRSFWQIPRFLRLTFAVQRQLAASPGLAGYTLLAQSTRKTFWTFSAWESAGHLDAFARAMPHLEVMRQLRPHMGRTVFKTWTLQGSALPLAWKDVTARLMREED